MIFGLVPFVVQMDGRKNRRRNYSNGLTLRCPARALPGAVQLLLSLVQQLGHFRPYHIRVYSLPLLFLSHFTLPSNYAIQSWKNVSC